MGKPVEEWRDVEEKRRDLDGRGNLGLRIGKGSRKDRVEQVHLHWRVQGRSSRFPFSPSRLPLSLLLLVSLGL